MTNASSRDGFSLVEVIVAMMILSFGVLALSASTGYLMNQIRSADIQTERVAALGQASERLRAFPYESLETECESFSQVTDNFTVTCAVESTTNTLTRLQLVATGPGYTDGSFVASKQHTIVLNFAE